MHYIDAEQPDGLFSTKQVKLFYPNLNSMSERAARSEHARIMAERKHPTRQRSPCAEGANL